MIGLGSELHPQGERAQAAVGPVAAPVAAEKPRRKPVQVEAVTIHVAGVDARPEAVERDALGGGLEVSQDEARDEGDIAEACEVVSGQLEVAADGGEELDLLVLRLRDAALEDPGDPEDDGVLRGLVREVPALQIAEAIVAGTELRGVGLQGEAGADAVADRSGLGDAVFGGELAVLREGRPVLLGNVGVGERGEVLDRGLGRSRDGGREACDGEGLTQALGVADPALHRLGVHVARKLARDRRGELGELIEPHLF